MWLLASLPLAAKIGYEGPKRLVLSTNMPSIMNDPVTMESQLKRDLKLRRVIPHPAIDPYICSALGFVAKGDGGWRKIHNLSAPAGRPINDGIPEEYRSIGYPYFDDIVAAILEAGQNCYIVKRCLSNYNCFPQRSVVTWLQVGRNILLRSLPSIRPRNGSLPFQLNCRGIP